MFAVILTLMVALLCNAQTIADKIAAGHAVVSEDEWYGFHRVKFDFNGYTAWIVEPSGAPTEDKSWTWTMQWAEAFVPRTGVPDLLARGFYHVTLEAFGRRAVDEALPDFAAFQTFLTDTLGLAPKANLIGMSWGGFFSVRYASAYLENVRRIYLDAPLLNLEGFDGDIGPWKDCADGASWSDDPRMPINVADKVAAAGIPILLLYGGQDQTVNPVANSEIFVERFKAAGGDITIKYRSGYGHHPHGLDPGSTDPIVVFFE